MLPSKLPRSCYLKYCDQCDLHFVPQPVSPWTHTEGTGVFVQILLCNHLRCTPLSSDRSSRSSKGTQGTAAPCCSRADNLRKRCQHLHGTCFPSRTCCVALLSQRCLYIFCCISVKLQHTTCTSFGLDTNT